MHSFKREFCYGTCGCKKCDRCYLFLAHAASGKCNIPSAHPDKVSTFCKKKFSRKQVGTGWNARDLSMIWDANLTLLCSFFINHSFNIILCE
jgi:hypothetical protein